MALGKLGGLALLLGELLPEFGLLKPTMQGAAVYLSPAGGLGDGGGGGEDGEGGLLAGGEARDFLE